MRRNKVARAQRVDKALDKAFKIQERKPPIMGMPNLTWVNDGGGDFFVNINGDKDRGVYGQILETRWALMTSDKTLKKLPKFLYADIYESPKGIMMTEDPAYVIGAIEELEKMILDLLM